MRIKKVFAIGGLSESGKSSAGQYLDSKGITRLKIATLLKTIMEKEYPGADFNKWQPEIIVTQSEWLWKRFSEELVSQTEEENIEHCAIESLYRPGLAQSLRKTLADKLVILYVDIPQEIRLQRQIIRQNLKDIDESKACLLPRDKDKLQWGALEIKELADVIIDNSGTISELYCQLDVIMQKYCPEL